MKDLSTITIKDFQTSLEQTFLVTLENTDYLKLELTEVKAISRFDPKTDTRQSFSLLFRGPFEPILPQQSYQIKNEQLGELLLFLVPIGPDKIGMLYDATFN